MNPSFIYSMEYLTCAFSLCNLYRASASEKPILYLNSMPLEMLIQRFYAQNMMKQLNYWNPKIVLVWNQWLVSVSAQDICSLAPFQLECQICLLPLHFCLLVTNSGHILEVIKLRSSQESKSFTCIYIEDWIVESHKPNFKLPISTFTQFSQSHASTRYARPWYLGKNKEVELFSGKDFSIHKKDSRL